ncbi:unnamed protein product [Choristocarpus tenellus]
MPGGLVSWLGEPRSNGKRERDVGKERMMRTSKADTGAGPGQVLKQKGMQAEEGGAGSDSSILRDPHCIPLNTSGDKNDEQEHWDPFDNGEARLNVYSRLLEGRRSTATTFHSPEPAKQVPSLSPSRKETPQQEAWDPFADAPGKENRQDAFARLLAASSDRVKGGRKTPPSGGASHGAKKRRRPAQGAEGGDSMTSFCSCPVCGKRVIIKLCSQHLDKDCQGKGPGSTSEATTFVATSMKVMSHIATGIKPDAGATGADLVAPVNLCTSESTTGDPTRDSTVVTIGKVMGEKGGKRSLGGIGPQEGHGNDACVTTDITTSCPICGKKVRPDMCSQHLDTDCSGSKSIQSEGEGRSAGSGKEAGGCAASKGARGGGGSHAKSVNDGSMPAQCSGGQRGKGEGQDDARAEKSSQSMSALAAELTCPVCLCLFENPQVLPCSHRFCLTCIMGCFKTTTKQECPLCKMPSWKRDMKKDVSLQNIIRVYKDMTGS